MAGGAGPSPLAARQAGASGEPSSKTSDDDAGESPEKEGGRRQKLTAKQAQELEALFQADPSGPAGEGGPLELVYLAGKDALAGGTQKATAFVAVQRVFPWAERQSC